MNDLSEPLLAQKWYFFLNRDLKIVKILQESPKSLKILECVASYCYDSSPKFLLCVVPVLAVQQVEDHVEEGVEGDL